MRAGSRRGGFTLVEVLIVVVIMAVLAATIIPQFSDSTRDAKVSTALFNLQTVRAQIQFYRCQHDGKLLSANLAELMARTDAQGNIGAGATHTYGPYLTGLPENPFTGSKTLRATATNPPAAASGANDAGWLYHAATTNIWLDNAEFLSK